MLFLLPGQAQIERARLGWIRTTQALSQGVQHMRGNGKVCGQACGGLDVSIVQQQNNPHRRIAALASGHVLQRALTPVRP